MLIASTVIACTTIWAVAASIMAYNRGREVDDMVDRHHSVVDQLTATKVELDNAKSEHRARERDLERTYIAALDEVANLTEDIEEWKGLYASALNRANRFEAMHQRMTTRNRDPKTGRIVKAEQPKTHTLRHGMTVKDPTPEQAEAIFDEARRLRIPINNEGRNPFEYPWIWFSQGAIFWMIESEDASDIYLTDTQFIAYMRGEDPALAAFDEMMGNAIDQLKRLTVRTLCDEVKENAVNDIAE